MDSVSSFINNLEKKQILRPAEIEFAHLWTKLDPKITNDQILIFTASLHFEDHGHVALDQEMLTSYLDSFGFRQIIDLDEALKGSILVGKPGLFTPFIYWNSLLYQQKRFEQERALANWLIEKSNTSLLNDRLDLSNLDDRFSDDHDDLQKQAVIKSFKHSLLFITGGPGTGKTYTVQQIIESHKKVFGDSYSIKIAAPTGKAAQRINKTISDDEVSNHKAVTIHQMLGASGQFGAFRFNRQNPVPADLVIIDEASMMDLNLWSKLTDAISTNTRLIVVGDPFQLASVESGAVLSDICLLNEDKLESTWRFQDSIIELQNRHRFSNESGINNFAYAINTMNVDLAFELFADSSNIDLKWIEPSSTNIKSVLMSHAIEPSISEKISSIKSFRILTALRNGQIGCNNLNRIVERDLKRMGGYAHSVEWFDKRVVMANKNDYKLGLQNGEIGYYDENSKTINFGLDKNIPSEMITNYESGYCITIHKSQGSEYENVVIILPEQQNALLSKELLYTAVTRARKSVLVVGSKEILTHCISNKTKRKSGLTKQLRSLLD